MKETLIEMIKCISPSGKEDMLQKYIAKKYKTENNEFLVDEKGALTGIYNKNSSFKVMLAAHADEISLIVTGYNSNGTLTVERNGGIRSKLYIGTKVQILTPTGILKAVVGTNGSLQKKSDVDCDELFVDLGLNSADEAKSLVPLGSYIVHDTDVVELQNNCLAGRAFDDRVGDYIIHEASKKAFNMGAKVGIYTTTTTGEETTGRGAYSAAMAIKPNLSIIVDVTYATDYAGAGEPGDVRIGGGGVICNGSIPNRKLNDLLRDCAKELNIPVQEEVFAGRTGTDGDTIVKTNDGVPQVLFSIPLRYMHSPVEVLSFSDVEGMIDILALFLTKINDKIDLKPYSIEE